MPLLERNGARIVYEVSGSGPPMLLGHSLLCDAQMWELVAPELSKSFRTININVRGHGGSTAPAPFTLEDLADDWLAIMDNERIDSAILCGLSMGGMTSMRLALAHPSRVRALILLDTSADPELPQKRVQYRAMAEILLRFGHLRPLHEIVKRLLFGQTTLAERPAIADRTISRLPRTDPYQIYHAVRAVIDRGALPNLSSIQCPTLILVGNEDRATPPDRAERIASRIPSSRLRYIPFAGHLSPLESPAAVLNEILEFTKTLPTP